MGRAFRALAPQRIVVGAQSPQQDSRRDGFDHRVETEAHQSDAAGHQPGDERDRRFEAIPGDREIFQAPAARHQGGAIKCDGRACGMDGRGLHC